MAGLKTYLLRIFIALTQLLNTLFSGRVALPSGSWTGREVAIRVYQPYA